MYFLTKAAKVLDARADRRKIIAGPESATKPSESNCAIIFQLIIQFDIKN